MEPPSYVDATPEGSRIRVVVTPGARRDEIVGPLGDHLKVRVRAAPEKGKATEAVAALLAETLALRAAAIECRTGMTARKKTFLVRGISPETVLDSVTLVLSCRAHERP